MRTFLSSSLLLVMLGACVHTDELPPALPEERVVFQPPIATPEPEPAPLNYSVPASAVPVIEPTPAELIPPKKSKDENPEAAVAAAYKRSIVSPSTEGFRGGTSAIQNYRYNPNQIYEIYSSSKHPTSLVFPRGEWLAAPPDIDEHFWDVGKLEMGEGEKRQEVITIRPVVAGLDSTVHFFTQSGLTFICRIRSFAKTSMPVVSWDMPPRLAVQSPRTVAPGTLFPKRQGSDAPLLDPSRLHTSYAITVSKGSPPWIPLAVYDDGTRTVIQFKEDLAFTSAPAPFALDQEGKIVLLQFTPYKVPGAAEKGTYYIVQGLHPRIELRGDGGMVVTITRNTGQPAPYQPAKEPQS